jgi:Cys-rich protein (TIGR01571 family)
MSTQFQEQDMTTPWPIGLFEIGDCKSCLYSFFLLPCAFAQARRNMDESGFWVNCLGNPPQLRWLMRSAYGIYGSPWGDALVPCFCTCCSVNQMLQTSMQYGIPAGHGIANLRGRWIHENPNLASLPAIQVAGANVVPALRRPGATGKDYLYACLCMPCANATALEMGVGMPWYLGCCCMSNPMYTKNILRLQYKLEGQEVCRVCLLAQPNSWNFALCNAAPLTYSLYSHHFLLLLHINI